ncbi:MAG: hypothetical protein A2007_03115 [Verrucomicrobia bacterium GWC2_42_7]|nr:MAG: hypothetical protein A2007_03115 [Verrucomicrobia bacterium GWC2_42_7]
MEEAAFRRGYEQAGVLYNSQILETRNDAAHLQSQVFSEISQKYTELVKEIQDRIPPLLFSLFRKVLPNVSISEETIKGVLDEFFEEMTSQEGDFTVYLCPRDIALIEKNEPTFKKKYNITFEADPALKAGDCVLRSKFGITDGRIETKARRIEAELLSHDHA